MCLRLWVCVCVPVRLARYISVSTALNMKVSYMKILTRSIRDVHRFVHMWISVNFSGLLLVCVCVGKAQKQRSRNQTRLFGEKTE